MLADQHDDRPAQIAYCKDKAATPANNMELAMPSDWPSISYRFWNIAEMVVTTEGAEIGEMWLTNPHIDQKITELLYFGDLLGITKIPGYYKKFIMYNAARFGLTNILANITSADQIYIQGLSSFADTMGAPIDDEIKLEIYTASRDKLLHLSNAYDLLAHDIWDSLTQTIRGDYIHKLIQLNKTSYDMEHLAQRALLRLSPSNRLKVIEIFIQKEVGQFKNGCIITITQNETQPKVAHDILCKTKLAALKLDGNNLTLYIEDVTSFANTMGTEISDEIKIAIYAKMGGG